MLVDAGSRQWHTLPGLPAGQLLPGARQDTERQGERVLHADRLLGACTELNHTIVPYQHRQVLDAITALFSTTNVGLKKDKYCRK